MLKHHVLQRVKDFWRYIAHQPSSPAPKKNVEQIYSKGPVHYNPEQKKRLEALCERLFEQKELITAGRLQFLGLGKIKRRLGKVWPGLQKIVFQTAEDAISKYLMPSDIFIRYKDDTYVIIFANSNPVEAQVKASLIAEEIRRQLFDHEQEELRDISVKEGVAIVPVPLVDKAKPFDDAVHVILQNISDAVDTAPPRVTAPAAPISIVPTLEVDAYAPRNEAPPPSSPDVNPHSFRFSYVPLWDIKKNILTTYLCLARNKDSESDPLDNHEHLFVGVAASEKTRLDLLMLKTVAQELAAMAEDGRKLFIACPVHFDTLFRGESYAQYIVACQNIPADHKRYLIFLLLDLPVSVHGANVHKFSVPLRGHCAAIYAQVPLDTKVDFAMLRDCRFDAVGVRLKRLTGGEKHVLEMLENFSHKARSALINKIFALDVASLSITTSSVCAGYDMLGGTAIHEAVFKPDSVYRFKYDNLFVDLIKDQSPK